MVFALLAQAWLGMSLIVIVGTLNLVNQLVAAEFTYRVVKNPSNRIETVGSHKAYRVSYLMLIVYSKMV